MVQKYFELSVHINLNCTQSLYSYYLQSLQTFILKVLADFRGESICRLSWKVFADFGGNNYTEFRIESLYSYYIQSLCRLLL